MKKLRLGYLVLGLVMWLARPTFAQQQYMVTIDTTGVQGTAGSIVFDLAHINAADNGATISDYSNGVPVTNETVGTGNGSTTTFNHTAARTPVTPSSLSVTYAIGGSVFNGTDDGAGKITGTDITSGSINYASGAISISFSSAPGTGTSITTDYTFNGGTQGLPLTEGGFVSGDIILGSNPAPSTTIDASAFGNPFFFTELQIPFASFGRTITFSLQLTANRDTTTPLDELAFFILDARGQSLIPTADPLLADTIFTICIDGTNAGLLNTYMPATFTSPGTINLTATVPAAAATVTDVMPANSAASPGKNASAGSFNVDNAGTPISVNSVDITESDPTLFSSFSLTVLVNGTPVSGATAQPGTSSPFDLQPPVTIPQRSQATFNLVATINPGASPGGVSSQSLDLLSGTGSQGTIRFGGLPADLGTLTVSCGGVPDGTPCDDRNACTGPDICQSGVCRGACQVGKVCGSGCAGHCMSSGGCVPTCSCQ